MTSFRERSLAAFPAGSNGEFDLPPELAMVIDRGEGCRLWDTDGREFLDFSMGWGSALVGHARAEVTEAVQRQATRGANFAYVTENSLLLAEEIVDKVCLLGVHPQHVARPHPGQVLRDARQHGQRAVAEHAEVEGARDPCADEFNEALIRPHAVAVGDGVADGADGGGGR